MTKIQQSSSPGSRWERAVVVGGGYAGLVTARVLADHFREVLVLEHDPVRSDTGVHPHVPQGYHAHALLARGGEALEALFPGLREELAELGAPVLDYGERMSFLLPTGYAPTNPVGVAIQSLTRDELERCLRQRVLGLPAVRVLPATRCETVTASAPGRLDRVRYRTDDADGSEEVTADLVVDTSGRSTSVDRWLTDARLPVSAKTVIKAKITYTSACYERPPQDRQDFDIAYQMAFAPDVRRGGVILAVERDRWMCSLLGVDEHVPPTDDEGYLDFAHSLANPRLAEQIKRGTRQGEIHRYTNPGNEWRLHHKNARWPERLIAVGDSLCVFNPVYGQGLTVAALEAELLGRLLRRRRADAAGLDGLSRAYQRAAARVIKVPWTMATSSDLMWAPAGQPRSARFAQWYNKHVLALAVHDPGVWARFVRVLNMTAPPSLLFRPAVLAKVVRRALTRRRI
ncbi:FAD-dependent monooxygenase [Streptomyces sp. NBC_01381]|uniref:FAD-dependent oxidoreductase n=1 Tax=Streptomyces sp. NBC_01381 TaxID=2903845 RepID=UPI0022516F92|nr:FAD-dependent monooxygenase [Streptomyces sp. NBC_01381]MCX4672233.1 FAD-dependent monooxygenase [Streptomyces sp. NBC_01381]